MTLASLYATFTTEEEFKAEHIRLWNWRDLWTRLSNRSNRTGSGGKRSKHAIFLASLQTRDESVQQRAWIKNQQVVLLMKAVDAWREKQRLESGIPQRIEYLQKQVVRNEKGINEAKRELRELEAAI